MICVTRIRVPARRILPAISIPFAKWRFYTVLLIGKEQRSLHRLRGEGAVSRPFNLLVYICLTALLGAMAVGVVVALGLRL